MSDYDVYELAMHLCGIPEDDEASEIDGALYDKYEISVEQLEAIARELLALIDVGESPLTGTRYKGFSNGRMWLMKQAVPPQGEKG